MRHILKAGMIASVAAFALNFAPAAQAADPVTIKGRVRLRARRYGLRVSRKRNV